MRGSISSRAAALVGALLALAVFVSSAFVGGAVVAVVVSYVVLSSSRPLRSSDGCMTAAIQAFLRALLTLLLLGSVLIPLAKRLPIIRNLMFSVETPIGGAYGDGATLAEAYELRRLPLMIVFTTLLLIDLFRRSKRAERSKGHSRLEIASSLIPVNLLIGSAFIVPAIRKYQSPLSYLAPTMSGDGRNFFLTVESIRIASNWTSLDSFMGQGNFLPTIAAAVSKGLGASGTLDIRDQYAVASVYCLMAAVATLALAAYVEQVADTTPKMDLQSTSTPLTSLKLSFLPAIAPAGVVLSSHGPIMNEVFRSGFLSLFGAMALTAAFFAASRSRSSREVLTYMLIAFFLVGFAYPLAIGLLLAVGAARAARYTWVRSGNSDYGLLFPSILGLSGTILLLRSGAWDYAFGELRERSIVVGAINFTDERWLYVFLASGIVVYLLTPLRSLKLVSADLSLSVPMGILLSEVFKGLRADSGLGGSGYYGEKNEYLAFYVVLFLGLAASILLMGVMIENFGKSVSRRQFLTSTVFCSLVGVAILSASSLSGPSRTFFLGGQDWSQPRAESVSYAVDSWQSGNVVFIDRNDPGEARMVNFWLPYFWRSPGFDWLYSNFSVDVGPVCDLLNLSPARVDSPDPTFLTELVLSCPEGISGAG